jgi:protein-L-isoaspartate(D-aspartate) O-methyltransferase
MNSSDFPPMRRNMVDCQLRTSGVNTAWVLEAMGACSREKYVPADRTASAYSDRPVLFSGGRALNPPLATALMIQAAAVEAGNRVLVIGAATGYLTALIAPHVASVTAVEEDKALFDLACANLNALPNVRLQNGGLNSGADGDAHYDVVIIDGAIAAIPDAILDQLVEGGRIICGLSDGAVTRLALGYKRGGAVSLRTLSDCGIVPLPGFERAKEFVF